MAIIYSYPLNQPKRDDLLIGTITYDEDAVNPVHGNPTVSFTVGSLLDLVSGQGNAQNLQQVTNIGNTTTNSIVISNNLLVSGGYYDSSNQPGTAGQLLSSTATGTQWVNVAAQGVTSVGLSMPAAFTVANSPVTQAGILAVTGAGTAAQYINGLGNLVTFPTIPTQYVLPVATTVALGGIKIGYTEAGKNYPLELDNERAYVNVPWTDTTYTLPLAADGTRGGVQIGYTQTATRDYPVTLDSEKMLVTVPWTDTQNPFQTITGTGSGNTDSGIILSDSGGTVLILGDGSVTAAQTGNTITLTGTDTGVTGVTLATADSTGSPLSESITNRELTITSAKYVGGANVGYVPEGGTATTYLKGDGTWASIPTGLIFKGVWDASGTGGGNPDLTSITPLDGWLYIVSVAGSAEPNGVGTTPNSWNVGDWCVYSSTASAWELVPSSTTGVDTVKTTDGTYIDLTPDIATNGAVVVTADLSATGTQDSTTFLRGDNTWDVPAYIPNTDTQNIYTNSWQQSTNDIILRKVLSGAGSGTQDIKIVKGANITFTYTDEDNFTIAATNTNTEYTAGVGLTLNTLEFDANVSATTQTVQPVAVTAVASRTYAVQVDDTNDNLVVNVPWSSGGTYDWEIKDNQGTPSTGDVASGKTVQFVGATGALSTVLTDPNSDGNFVMTLTSPNDNDDTLYDLAGAADASVAANYNLVLSADNTAQDTMVFVKGSNITFTRASNSLTIAAANDDTLYDLAGAASTTAGEYNLVLSADTTAQDTMVFKQGSNITFTRAADLLTITATNTWNANTKTVPGYVAAPGAVASKVWKTDASGNPAWRDDATGDNTTYSIASGNTKVITLTGSDSSTSTVTFADGNDISISGNNGTITIASTFVEADTLATVTGRGDTTTTKSYFNGDLEVNNTITVTRTGNNNGKISIEGNPPLLELKNYDAQTASDQLLSSIEFYGSDTSSSNVAGVRASINCNTGFDDPTGTSNRNQGCLEFATYNGTDVSNSPLQRLKITPDGGFSFGNTSTAYGTAGQLLKSNGDAPPSWVNAPVNGVTSVAASTGGDALDVGGTPITSTGTLSFTWAGADTEYVDGEGNLVTFPTIPQGDITAVTAGTDLSGGGTSGAVTLNNTSTLATVTGRGATTTTASTFNGGLVVKNEITVNKTNVNTPGKIIINGNTDATLQLKSEDTSLAANETLGVIEFYGSDGTAPGAGVKSSIRARNGAQTGGIGDTSNLIFAVSDGLSNNNEALRINPTGSIAIDGATKYGTSGQVLTSAGDAPPTWETPGVPVATTTVLGGIELGSDTALTTAYVTGSVGSTTRSYPVQLNAARQAAVYVPWTDSGDTTYSAGNGINFSGTPATQINADINYISYSGNNNFIIYGTQNDQGTTIPTGSQIAYADPSGTQIVSRGLISDLPFSNNSGTVTSVTAGTGMTQTGTSTVNPTLNVIAGNGLTANANNITMSGSYTGTFTATGDLVAYSDKKLKSNVKTLDGSKVYAMRGVSFDKDDKKGSGVIAQELEKIAPELIHDEGEYKAVAYGNISGYLIEAIKELKAEIEELKLNKCNCK